MFGQQYTLCMYMYIQNVQSIHVIRIVCRASVNEKVLQMHVVQSYIVHVRVLVLHVTMYMYIHVHAYMYNVHVYVCTVNAVCVYMWLPSTTSIYMYMHSRLRVTQIWQLPLVMYYDCVGIYV